MYYDQLFNTCSLIKMIYKICSLNYSFFTSIRLSDIIPFVPLFHIQFIWLDFILSNSQ